eukprot:3549277-Pleurochrysis_carterae.AAC.4
MTRSAKQRMGTSVRRSSVMSMPGPSCGSHAALAPLGAPCSASLAAESAGASASTGSLWLDMLVLPA